MCWNDYTRGLVFSLLQTKVSLFFFGWLVNLIMMLSTTCRDWYVENMPDLSLESVFSVFWQRRYSNFLKHCLFLLFVLTLLELFFDRSFVITNSTDPRYSGSFSNHGYLHINEELAVLHVMVWSEIMIIYIHTSMDWLNDSEIDVNINS